MKCCHRAVLAVLGMLCSFNAVAVSIPTPFLFQSLDSKNVGSTITSIVFALFPLAGLLVSLWISRRKSDETNMKQSLNDLRRASFLSAIAAAMFAYTLNYLPAMLFVRSLQGALGAFCTTSAYALVSDWFPDQRDYALAVMESMTGIGYVLGFALGGSLFSLGGFKLPFLSLSAMLLAQSFATLILPSPNTMASQPLLIQQENTVIIVDNNQLEPLVFSRIQSKGIIILIVLPFVIEFAFAAIYPVLAVRLVRSFVISEQTASFFFTLSGLLYVLTTPVTAHLSVKFNRKCVVISGLIMSSIGWLTLSNASSSARSTASLAVLRYAPLCVSLALIEIGCALSFVPSLPMLVDACSSPNSIASESVHTIASAWWMSSLSIGQVIGPVYGINVATYLSFDNASLSIGITFVLVVAVFALQVDSKEVQRRTC